MLFRMPVYREPDFAQDKFSQSPDAVWETVTADGVAPENYHSTSMFPEYFKIQGQWMLAKESPHGFQRGVRAKTGSFTWWRIGTLRGATG